MKAYVVGLAAGVGIYGICGGWYACQHGEREGIMGGSYEVHIPFSPLEHPFLLTFCVAAAVLIIVIYREASK